MFEICALLLALLPNFLMVITLEQLFKTTLWGIVIIILFGHTTLFRKRPLSCKVWIKIGIGQEQDDWTEDIKVLKQEIILVSNLDDTMDKISPCLTTGTRKHWTIASRHTQSKQSPYRHKVWYFTHRNR